MKVPVCWYPFPDLCVFLRVEVNWHLEPVCYFVRRVLVLFAGIFHRPVFLSLSKCFLWQTNSCIITSVLVCCMIMPVFYYYVLPTDT